MQNENGHAEDNFTLYASPLMGVYHVFVYPEVPGEGQDFEVSAARFADFRSLRQDHIEENQLVGSDDVFMNSLTEEDVRELTQLAPTPDRLRILPFRAA